MDSFSGGCLTGSVGGAEGPDGGFVGAEGISVGTEAAPVDAAGGSLGVVAGADGMEGACVAPMVGLSASDVSVGIIGSVGAEDALGGSG